MFPPQTNASSPEFNNPLKSCRLCRQHGVFSRSRHQCQFEGCTCQKCSVIRRQRRLMAQQMFYRRQNKLTNMEKVSVDFDLEEPDGTKIYKYTCQRCKNHGFIVPKKNHRGDCPYYLCTCEQCALMSDRARAENELKRKCFVRNKDLDKPIPMGLLDASQIDIGQTITSENFGQSTLQLNNIQPALSNLTHHDQQVLSNPANANKSDEAKITPELHTPPLKLNFPLHVSVNHPSAVTKLQSTTTNQANGEELLQQQLILTNNLAITANQQSSTNQADSMRTATMTDTTPILNSSVNLTMSALTANRSISSVKVSSNLQNTHVANQLSISTQSTPIPADQTNLSPKWPSIQNPLTTNFPLVSSQNPQLFTNSNLILPRFNFNNANQLSSISNSDNNSFIQFPNNNSHIYPQNQANFPFIPIPSQSLLSGGKNEQVNFMPVLLAYVPVE